MDTHESQITGAGVKGFTVQVRRCSESLEMGRQPYGGDGGPEGFMTVLMFGLGLEGCMPGKGLGDQRANSRGKAQRCPVVGAAAQGKVVERRPAFLLSSLLTWTPEVILFSDN